MNRFVKILLLFFLLPYVVWGQNYNMTSGTVNVSCSGTHHFYDSGGPNGNYNNNQDITKTFTVSGGQCLQVSFTLFDLESVTFDYLKIYDGNSTSSPLIGTYGGSNSPGTIISSSGSLTFQFHSDGSVNKAGWDAIIGCVECPLSYNMSNGVETVNCSQSIRFYDSGGPSGDYSNNSNYTQTFVSSDPDRCLQVSFMSFHLQFVNYDYLSIYDGTSTSAPLIGQYGGTTSPGVITSTSGALTFVFHSNNSTHYEGWSAIISCIVCPSPPPSYDPCEPNGIHAFCTEDNDFNVAYPSVTGQVNASSYLGSNDYSCLYSTPRPCWFYMQIEQAGNLLIYIEQYSQVLPNGQPDATSTPLDIDFVCWGPFTATSQEDFVSKLCAHFYPLNDISHGSHRPSNGNHQNDMGGYPDGNVIDCSYSAEATEWCFIPNAQPGEWYLLLVCNFRGGSSSEGYPGYFGFSSVPTSSYGGGQASTNCNLLAPISYNSPLCEGDTLTLTCEHPIEGGTYNWSGPNGWTAVTQVPTISIPNVTTAYTGQFSLQITGTSQSVNVSHVEVTVNAIPTVSISANHDTICSGSSVTLTADGAGTSAQNYHWTPGNTTGRNKTVTPSTTVDTVFTYTVTAGTGNCIGTASYDIAVFPKPNVVITAIPDNATICKGDTAILYASGGESYEWRQGNNTSAISLDDSLAVSPQSNTTYRVIATSAAGCTKSVTKTVVVRPLPNASITGADQVCMGDSVLLTASPNGSAYTYLWSTGDSIRSVWMHPAEDTDYEVVVTNNYGCTSSALKHVSLFLTDTLTYRDTICWNELFQDENFTIDETPPPGEHLYERLYSSSVTCDSLVRLYLTVLPKPFVVEYDTTCVSYQWRGRTYTQSGVYLDSISDEHGCLQVDTLHLVINQSVTVEETLTLCGSDLPYAYRDTVFEEGTPESSTFSFRLFTPDGCDSIVVLHLTIHYAESEVSHKDTCSYYQWHGTNYTSDGIYTYPTMDGNNCPRTDTLILTIYNPSPASMSAHHCDSYQWNGTTYYQSGVYTFGHVDEHGCWQVDTLHLTITPPTHVSETHTACGSYEWHETNYTQSGTYYYPHTDANGCTQVDTLHLTVYNPVPTINRVIVCEPYPWHGNIHDESGIYTYEYTDQHNCQCVDTLYLRVTSEPELLLNAVIDATCNQNNGEVKISPSGGTQPYRYVYLPDNTEAAFEGLSMGNYHLQMIDSIGCTADLEFTIGNIIHQVNLVNVTDAHCGRADGSVQVAASGGFNSFTYQWSPPITSTTNVAEYVLAGDYSVAVVDSNGCRLSLSFRVHDIPGPSACFNFSAANESQVVFINCTSSDVVDWHWDFGDGQGSSEWQPSHQYDNPGEYPVVLTVEDANQCVNSVSLLYIIREVPTMYLPSAFIPESDIAENRVFKPIGNSFSEENYEMLVFDRWGQLVFVSRHPDLGWDGRINGSLAPQGTYSYQIKYQDLEGKPNSVHGSVLLLR